MKNEKLIKSIEDGKWHIVFEQIKYLKLSS